MSMQKTDLANPAGLNLSAATVDRFSQAVPS
jgi:hypothetical protein